MSFFIGAAVSVITLGALVVFFSDKSPGQEILNLKNAKEKIEYNISFCLL